MENLLLKGSSKTPTIHFDANKGVLDMKGRSIPENSMEFYAPLKTYINAYIQLKKPTTTVNIFLNYFNTNSLKCIFDVLKLLQTLLAQGCEVAVNWYYEEGDEDMLDYGHDFQSVLKIPFNLVEVTAKTSV